MARLDANLAAIKVVKALQAEGRAAIPAEQEILARWSGWGAVAAVFAEKPGEDRAFVPARQQLRTLLTDKEYASARFNTINAHYTGTALAQAMWDGLAAFGFTGGRVLEPGCGSGNFIGLAPLGTAMAGIELDPVTAHVAAALYPHAQIRNESFADTQLPEGSFDAAIGNVPFGKLHLKDARYNPGRRHPIHTHFVLKSAALVRPGGWIALITSRYTLDGTGEDAVAARRQLAGLGELAAAVRLPATAHRRTAGTDVVTDVLVIRRFEDGEHPPPGEPSWIQTVPVDVDGVQIPVNRYFADHPGMVLGDLAAGGARRSDDLLVIAPAGADVAGGLATSLARAAAGRAAPPPRPAPPAAGTGRPPEGFQHARPDGTFTRITDGIAEPFDPPGGQAGHAELRALLGLRDVTLALLDAELATSEDTGLVDDLRAGLNARYDTYVAAYGPVNRHTRQVRLRDTPAGRALREQLLADGHARYTGGILETSDPAVRDQLVAAGHATITGTGELRFRRTRAARAEQQRLLDSGQARAQGGTLTLTEAGHARVLENAPDLKDAVTIIRVRPSQGGFRHDPFAVRVQVLEKYDPETGTARKNDIMRHRVLLPRPAVDRADDPKDALAICMDQHAQVRLDVIAALLGAASEQDARDRLGTLVFHDPAEGRLVPAPEYLSGDVRAKLRQAVAAAADDPAYQVNVQALTEVIPPDLGPVEIEARLGAVFITPARVQQFLREILADEAVTVTLGADATWSVSGGDRHSVAATITWGTPDRDALSLAGHLLNRRGPVEVTRKNSDGSIWTDEEATQAARGKQAELSDRFAGWAWEDLDRAGEICRLYNDAFNSIVLRSYDEVQLSLPGVNRDISPFWWQKAAIARMIYEPSAGLFHDMGAGKTLEQIIGVMEQKRLGLIRKPVICVKNHLLDQFRDEFLWAYPQARILCADTDDLAGEGRRQFIARCAAENPDAIIMTRGAFESIPLTPEGHEAYLAYMKQMFQVHADAVTESVKDEETLLAEFEEKLRAYFDPGYQKDENEDGDEPDRKRRKRKVEQDPAMCWEQMGIDYVCIDESQDYNNLWVPSDEPGMAIGFTHRSIDLEMKLHAIRRRYGSRACTLATGTPVTNKIPQFYVLQRYLRPERLQAAGFTGYAPWAATFTEPEQRLEMKADGQFGMVPRMRLINFPELLLDLHYFGDFKEADDIGLPRPAIRGGKTEISGVPAVTELLDYQSTLPERYGQAKGGKKKKGDDTVVAVIGDGFRAAQDLRLVKANHGVRPQLTDEPQKIDCIADDVYAEWLKHRDDVYPGEDGQPDPVRGSLQLVFCNEGVPSNDWNLYDELRNLLAERGMRRSAIRFIHDANDARKKAALFAACNAGHVAVLIGSTEKMGVGTNVQRRVIGVHHVHPHWRPDYDAQEDARARRPGNLNAEVFIKKWVTEGSFDTIRAQACERKSVFLRVVKHRDTSIRSIEAPDDDTVGYAAVAAVGAGEPRLIQKAQLESELQQLVRTQRRHANNQNALKIAEQQALAAITAAEQTIRDIDAAAVRLIPTSGDAFRMTVDGTAFASRREAGDHLIACLRGARARIPAGTCQTKTVGMIGGFLLGADLARDGRADSIVLRLTDLPGGELRLDHRKLPSGIGLVTRLENRLSGLDKLRLEQQAIIGRQRQEITRAQSAIGAPFPQQDALLATQKALDALVLELRSDKDGKKTGPATAASGPPGAQPDESRSTRADAETPASGQARTQASQASNQHAEAESFRARLDAPEKELSGAPDAADPAGLGQGSGAAPPAVGGAGSPAPSSHRASTGTSGQHGPRGRPPQASQPARPPASPASGTPAANPREMARHTALAVLGGAQGGNFPDAEEFADHFARTYGHTDPGTWPPVMQVYADEWLLRQPDDRPLKTQARADPETPARDNPDAVPVCIPNEHPSLPAALQAATMTGPQLQETAAPAPGTAPAARPAPGDTATPGGVPAQDPPCAADSAHPDGQGLYASRIRISDAPRRPVVSGTSYADDPPELREALRDNAFTWRKQRKVWEYTGRDGDRGKSVKAIRDLLARLDRDAVPATGTTLPPTPQQQAILDACIQGKNVAVQALAGTGKTTTLVLVARALMDRSPGTRIIYTAFNADIVADARRGRFGRNVTAMTMHSIAKQALLGTSYAAKITDGGQGARWPEQWADVLGIPALPAAGGDPVPAEAVARLVIATVRKFRESADEHPGRQHLPGHLAGAAQGPLAQAVVSYAGKAWADISDTTNAALLASGRALRVDHDDYLKVWALCGPRIGADVIFFDEAQDVNAVMRQVILDQPAQTIVVGDSHQSIYGFRGAIDALKDWPADVVLPLTQSWRFGPEAAEFGNLFLRSLGSELLLEGNPALDTRLGRADDPDAILCRTNATAVAEVFSGLESGKRVALAGGGQAIKDIAKAARDLQAGRGTKHPDLSKFSDWDEVRAYAEQEEDGKSLQVFVRLVDRHGPDGLIDMISRLTPEGDVKDSPQLTISTTHKAKGRQWPKVRIGGDYRGPVTDPGTGETTWPSPEERRLAYVAATRAQGLLETGSLSWIYDYPQVSTPDVPGTQQSPSPREVPVTAASRPAATPQPPPPAVDTSTAAASQPTASPDGEAVTAGHPQELRPGTPEDAPAADDAEAGQVVAAARRRADEREQAHVPIDYERANVMIRRQRAALTRAVNSGNPGKVVLAAQRAVSEWNQPGMAWPDDWSRWQRALDDAVPGQGIRLEDLPDMPVPDMGTSPTGKKPAHNAGAPAKPVPGPAPGTPADDGAPEPAASPVNNSDLAIALRRLPGEEFARFVSQAGTPHDTGSRLWRRDGEPDAGAREELDRDASGITITISVPGTRRHGRVSWPQVASWIDTGITPARLGLIVTADRLQSFCHSARDRLSAAGKCDPDAAAAELIQIRDDAISTVITAALSARGAAAPVPPARQGQPAYHTAAMTTRPDPAASKTENSALEQLARLRAEVREPQPVSAAEVRAAIRRWIGDGLPDYVRALDKPAKMRSWISEQVMTRAGRPSRGTYESPGVPGGRWYGASTEGLLTARGGDDRADSLIPWEEIPAWIQPGVTTSFRDRLLTADDRYRAVIRRRLAEAAHPQASPAGRGQESDDQADRLRREAISAGWAAIEAAPPPAPAQLEHARRTYRDTGPGQETLFGQEPDRHQGIAKDIPGRSAAPGQPPVPEEPRPAAQPGGAPATAATGSTPANSGRQHDAPAPAPAAAMAGGTARDGQPAPSHAVRQQPGSTGTTLTAADIVLGLNRLPAPVFADLIAIMDSGQPMYSVSRQLAPYTGTRAASEPDAGAMETVTAAPAGLRIQVTAASGTRAGLVSWPEVANWLRPGLTPARRQIVLEATRTRLRFAAANASFRAAGEATLAEAAEQELRTLTVTAINAVLDAARADQPRPGGRPSQSAGDEAEALERIADLAAALPARPPQPRTPVSQVKAGDIVGHPGYKLQPFRVTAPPRHHDDGVEITGHLIQPSAGEPTGQITFTLARNGQQDPVLLVVPLPGRSLRLPVPKSTAGSGIRQHGSDAGPGGSAHPGQGPGPGEPAVTPPRQHAPATRTTTNGATRNGAVPSAAKASFADVTGTGQPAGTATLIQEHTMPPPPPALSPASATAPATGPDPAPADDQAAGPQGSGSESRASVPPAVQVGDEAELLQELDHVLTAIIERRRAAAGQARAADDFAAIRAAFTLLRNAVDLGDPAARSPHAVAAVPDPAEAARTSPAAAHDGRAAAAGNFDDIRAAFADLRNALELPAQGRHARDTGPHPTEPADPAASRLLDQAAAEAQACARWYRDTPEWQRITKVSRAARELIGAIREASGDYWAEIRQDIRTRGFARTLTARVSLAVSGAAQALAGRLERAGHQDTRIWRAAWGLHRATTTFADRIMKYSSPAQQHPDRMNDVRRIIDDLGGRPRSPREPATPPASSASRRPSAPPSAVTLAKTSFPAQVSQATIRPPSGPARPAAAAPASNRRAMHRP